MHPKCAHSPPYFNLLVYHLFILIHVNKIVLPSPLLPPSGPSDWGAESFPVTQLPPPTTAQPAPAGGAGEDWAIDLVQSTTTTKDWGADEDTGDWGGTSTVRTSHDFLL